MAADVMPLAWNPCLFMKSGSGLFLRCFCSNVLQGFFIDKGRDTYMSVNELTL